MKDKEENVQGTCTCSSNIGKQKPAFSSPKIYVYMYVEQPGAYELSYVPGTLCAVCTHCCNMQELFSHKDAEMPNDLMNKAVADQY